MKTYFIEPGDWEGATGECLPSGSEGIEVTPVLSSEPVTEDWIRERWGGFTYLDIARNEDFMLDFKDKEGSLWLHYENGPVIGRVLLFDKPTKQNVIDTERIFGCID
jgi:hypothetical protein